MTELLTLIFLPLLAALLVILIPARIRFAKETIALLATGINLAITLLIFGKDIYIFTPWAGSGINFALRLYHFSSFIITAAAGFALLCAIFSIVFVQGKDYARPYFAYLLLTMTFVNGAILSDNLVLMLFFWEGMLLPLFGMIYIGGKTAFRTAIKSFVIVGITDLCLMVGIAMTGYLAGTLTLSKISLPLNAAGSAAFSLMMIGAISKAGAMPFHSWIPDAAIDAPLPFMAFLPASLEKLLGIYLLARISFDLFQLVPGSWVSTMLMWIGVITIILAVMMALIQKNYKRLLSYHAISQVGYMVLGIGTAVPAGMVGGLFHMINNAIYKSCLFLTGGSVEKQTGTAELEKLGGIGWQMPVTLTCFLIAAASISGVPPFNGFFSKELVYDGALERGLIFYLLAVIGSFFTAASFLKLGHAAFFGKRHENNRHVKEAHWSMLLPMIILAALCILFGLNNYLPLRGLIQPILGLRLEGHDFSGLSASPALIIITLIVMAAAIINHWFGVMMKGSGLKAADHFHYAPGLAWIYERAEKRYFDPYELALKFFDLAARISLTLDRAVDWLYDGLTVKTTDWLSSALRWAHNGSYVNYLVWLLCGAAVVIMMMRVF